MANLQEYKCPACGGALVWDGALGKLKCPYCDSVYELSAMEAVDAQLEEKIPDDAMDWTGNVGQQWGAGETDGLRHYACKSCGGEIIGDETLAATACPYCGNAIVMLSQFSGDLKPDLIIPFKKTKKEAKEAFKQHLQGKRFIPAAFKNAQHIDEIKGIYVPFWLFNAKADGYARYKAVKKESWTEGEYECSSEEQFTVYRSGSMEFENLPVDGDQKIADDLMESIEPFEYSELTPFKTSYLAGYMAEKYDVDAKECEPRVNERIKSSVKEALKNSVGDYDSVETENSSVVLSDTSRRYALMPVWLLNTKYQDKLYTFAMNGQTGRFIGDLPTDNAAAKKWFWLVALIVAVGVYALAALIHYVL